MVQSLHEFKESHISGFMGKAYLIKTASKRIQLTFFQLIWDGCKELGLPILHKQLLLYVIYIFIATIVSYCKTL